MAQIDPKILEQYVVTANSGKYKNWSEVNAKFPELSGYDPKVLEQYVVTANSGKYKSWDELNSKFPEFGFSQGVKSLQQPKAKAQPVTASMGAAAGGFAPPIANVARQSAMQPQAEATYSPQQFTEDAKKSFENLGVRLEGFLPRVYSMQEQAMSSVFGQNGLNILDRQTEEAARANLIGVSAQLSELESKQQDVPTILDGLQSGNLLQTAAGVVSAGTDVLSSIIVAAPTFGAGIIPDMISQSVRDFNTAKAESLGVSPEQLVGEGKDSFLVPASIGAIGSSLEYIGLKGITGAINKRLTNAAAQGVASAVFATGQEGLTEWTQFGLESIGTSLAQGKELPQAIEDGVDAMFSEQGLESALQGVGGAGATIATGRAINKIVEKARKGEAITPQEVAEAAKENAQSGGAVNRVITNLEAAGEIAPEQAQELNASIGQMEQAVAKVPSMFADRVTEVAPLIAQKDAIDVQIGQLEIEKATADESLQFGFDQQIAALNQQKEQLNAQIQQAVNQGQTQQTEQAGTADTDFAAAVGEGSGGVPQVGVSDVESADPLVRFAGSPIASLVGQRVSFTDANGNLIEGDAYVDGQRFVVEANGRIYDTFGSVEELSAMPQESLPVSQVQPRIIADEQGFTYNSDQGVMPVGTRITPQGKGLKAVKRDKNGVVKSVVVTAADGKTYNLKGEDAQALAYELMMDEISKGNLDAKVVLNEQAARTINAAVGSQTSGSIGQTQEAAQVEADGDTARTTDGRDGGRGRGGRAGESVTTKPKGETSRANEKPQPKGVPMGKQPEGSKGVREKDSKGKETAQESKPQKEVSESKQKAIDLIESAKAKRKAAIDVLKKQLSDAKSGGISVDIAKQAKENAEFFKELKDIVSANVEIGLYKISEIYADIEAVVGAKLNTADKTLIKKMFHNEVLRDLKNTRNALFEIEDVRDALRTYLKDKIEKNKLALNKAANGHVLKLINDANTEASAIRAMEYIDGLVAKAEMATALNEAADSLEKRSNQIKNLAGAERIITFLKQINPASIKKIELLQKMAQVLSSNRISYNDVRSLVAEIVKHVDSQMKSKGLTTKESVEKAIQDLTMRKGKDADGNTKDAEGKPVLVAKELDTKRKIKDAAKRVGQIEEAINQLQDIDEAERQVLIDQLDSAKDVITNASEKLKAEMEAERVANLKTAKEYIASGKAKKDLPQDIYDSYIAPIADDKDAMAAIDDMNYLQSEAFLEALSFASDGLLPIGFFRTFTQPLVGAKQQKAIVSLVDGGLTLFGKEVANMVKNGYNQARKMMFQFSNQKGVPKMEKAPSEKKVRKMFSVAYASEIDEMFGKAKEQLFNSRVLLPLFNAFKNLERTRKEYLTEFERSLGIAYDFLPSFTQKAKIKSLNKVGAFALQRDFDTNGKMGADGKPMNAIKENLKLSGVDSDATPLVSRPIDDKLLSVWQELDKEYPNGIKESDLTAAEKKILEAFDKLTSRLERLQRIANYRRGLPFTAIDNYAPMISLSGGLRFAATQLGNEQMSFKDAIELLNDANADAYRNVKTKSDRGLDRSENAESFIMMTNIADMAMSMTNDVLKDYYIFPEVYSAQKSFNNAAKQETAKTKSEASLTAILKERYKEVLVNENLKYTSPFYKFLQRVKSATLIEFLWNATRFAPEFIAGSIFHASSPAVFASPRTYAKSIFDALTTSANGNFKIAAEMASKGAYGQFMEAELTFREKMIRDGGKAAKTILSPDSFQESGFGRAIFIQAMKVEFKKLTGQNLAISKLSDPEYVSQYQAELESAAKQGLIESKIKPNTSFGRPIRPIYVPFTNAALFDASKHDALLLMRDSMYFLGGWAARTGRRAGRLASDSVTGSNYGRLASIGMLSGVIGSAVAYQLVRESQKYALASLFGDDEEEKEAAIRFERTVRSPQYIAGQFASSILFLRTGPFGTLGKALTFGSGDLLVRAIEWNAEMTGKSVVETKILTDNVKDFVKDATYQMIPASKQQSLDATWKILLGGAAVAGEQSYKFGESVTRLVKSAFTEDSAQAEDFVYALGTAWNTAYGNRIPIPFLNQIKKSAAEMQRGVDKEVMEYKKSKKNESKLMDEVIKKYAVQSLKNEITPAQATENIFRDLSQYMDDVPAKELSKKIADKFEDYTKPLFMKKIENAGDSFEQGAALRKVEERLKVSTEKGVEDDMLLLQRYIMKKLRGDQDDRIKFINGYNSVGK